jgi:SAM-dependent methyltransferase
MTGANVEEHNRTQLRYYEQGEKPGMRPTGSPYLRRHVDELVRFAGLQPGERVLEIGCGMGRYTLLLAEQGYRVEGLDLSSFLLERLGAYDGGRFDVPLHCVDVLEPPEKLLGAFDAVVGLFALHHLHDLDACFESMGRLVRPGGRLAFVEPNPLNPLYYVQMAVTPAMTWEGDRGMLRMRPKTIAAAARAAGLDTFAWRRFGFLPPFAMNTRAGARAEPLLERLPLWRPFLPFQLFRAHRP